MAGLEKVLWGFFEVLLVAAAFSDIRSYRIPNAIPAAMLAGFVVLALSGGSPSNWLGSLITLAVAFALGLGLWHLRVWGGGDAKLLAAMAPWVGLAHLPRLMAVMAVTGGVLAVIFLLRSVLTKTAPRHLPYGIALAVAGTDGLASITGIKNSLLSLGAFLSSFG